MASHLPQIAGGFLIGTATLATVSIAHPELTQKQGLPILLLYPAIVVPLGKKWNSVSNALLKRFTFKDFYYKNREVDFILKNYMINKRFFLVDTIATQLFYTSMITTQLYITYKAFNQSLAQSEESNLSFKDPLNLEDIKYLGYVRFKLYALQVLFQFGNGMIFARTRKVPKLFELGNRFFTLAWHIWFWNTFFVKKVIVESSQEPEFEPNNNDF